MYKYANSGNRKIGLKLGYFRKLINGIALGRCWYTKNGGKKGNIK
jgi:hypothetical protein